MKLFSRDRRRRPRGRPIEGGAATETQRGIDEILAQRNYWPVFQPIRDLGSNRVVGYEALTRFEAPLSPQRLFDHARLVGRGKELEVATMRAAVKAAAELPAHAWVSVNASGAMLSDADAIGAILDLLERPTVIELSEHEMIGDYGSIVTAMQRLGPGRTLAVDDAFSGLATLHHILDSRPAFVKMDISLAQGAATDLGRQALIAGFVHFAREADFTLIAKGIQTEDDLDMLKRLGVALGQGYLLGRPERAQFLEDQPAARTAVRRSVKRVHST